MMDNAGRRAFTLPCSEDEDRGELVCNGLSIIGERAKRARRYLLMSTESRDIYRRVPR